MRNCNVVTVCTTDFGYINQLNNSFIPRRRVLTKGERSQYSSGNTLSSVLKPVRYSELQDRFSVLMKQGDRCRNRSIDSEDVQQEINSAVLLLQSRNKIDMLNDKKDEKMRLCQDTVRGRNFVSISEQNVIGVRREREIPRWKSATTVEKERNKNISRISNVRMLTGNDSPVMKYGSISVTTPTRESMRYHHAKNDLPELIISSANSLTNSITIDDMSGAKDAWILGRDTQFHSSQYMLDCHQTINSPGDFDRPRPLKRREDMLRQYMDAYMHWRTVNAIEEHHRQNRNSSSYNKSGMTRNITPTQRLALFQKDFIMNQPIRRKSCFSTTRNEDKDDSSSNTIECTLSKCKQSSFIIQDDHAAKERTADIHIGKPSGEITSKVPETEEDQKSDTYSDIDWLESEDLS